MSYIVSIYGDKAFQKILLPAVNNADYNIILYRDLFALNTDLVLEMEIVDNLWSFKQSPLYSLRKDGADFFSKPIGNNDIIQLQTKTGGKLTILVYLMQSPFSVYRKYSLRNLRKVTIGKDIHNHIQYNYFDLVSKRHAILEITEDGCRVYDQSANGVFVNSVRVNHAQKLKFGDSVNILGLQILYLGDIIAVEQASAPVTVDHLVLRELDEEELQHYSTAYADVVREKAYFHRIPRNIEKVDAEETEIEDPPAAVKPGKQSLILSIGPAFSMAIPLVLGSMFSIYGSGNSSVMMYTGLITAVSSALIGSVWAFVNVKTARKDALAEEKLRREAYSEYLEKTRAEVREKYEKNTQILLSRYPAADVCASYGMKTPGMWNRNHRHTDFLFHRIGLGRIPFQAPIVVPKYRFQVEKDDLTTKPKDILVAFETLKDVPVGVDFVQNTLVGIVGGQNKIGALKIARNLLIQIAANNCYTDVKLGVVYNSANGYEDDFLKDVRWLPHVWSEDRKSRYVAGTEETANDVFYELSKVLRSREETENSAKETIPRPWHILFVTNPACLEDGILSKYIFSGEKKYGLSTVLLAERYEDLPNSCEFIIQNDSEFQGYYRVTDDISDRVPVRFDETDQKQFETFTRRLSGIAVNEVEKGGEIPESLTFFDMYGVHSPDQLDVLSSWRKSRTYDSMKALVGQKSGGVPCYLDIHEKYHGPHGLIAGTTGSGKSETLQTYILSLAVTYSPDDVGFFVIDYKGGGMANLFSNLPHLIGQISNLSGNQVHRAMVSIKSENRRRQSVFNEHGVNNINNYTRLYKNNEAAAPIPHLFIIIDEFAELKREEPDFMRELISVAQVGRSLGVHLILATQKPSGTVDDNIWSNAKFRLCLRVQDKQDSNDMLHKPDAAYITQAGRCYLQVGNDEIYELFQSGWSGAVYDEMEGGGQSEIARMYSITGKTALVGNRLKIRQKEHQRRNWITAILKIFRNIMSQSRQTVNYLTEDAEAEKLFLDRVFAEMQQEQMDYPLNEYNLRRLEDLLRLYAQALKEDLSFPEETVDFILTQAIAQGKKIPEARERTQLDAVVEYLAALARENGYTNQFTLWMPVLPGRLYLSELKGYSNRSFDGTAWPVPGEEWKLEAYMGLIDDPVNQSQSPLMINLSEGGHHAVCGTVVTGKSTFLQTLVYSLANSYSPDYVNFYLIDFSSHMLGAFEGLAHVGGIIYENDLEKLGKFFNLMREIMVERKRLLQGGNYAQYVKANGVTIPALVIAVDQFSSFREKTGGVYDDELLQISRNGAGYGIYLVVSAAGFGMNEIPNRIGDNIRTVLSLEMSDKYQYADVLHTLQIGVYPESGVKGRGIVNRDGDVLEFQTALCLEAEDDYIRSERIEEKCRQMNRAWNGKRARQIPEIPENPTLSGFMELEDVRNYLSGERYLPLGYNEENASVYCLDLSEIFCWLIQGRKRSGKTNVLKILMNMAIAKGAEAALIDLQGNLKNAAQKIGINYLQTEEEMVSYLRGLLPMIQERNAIKKAAIAEDLEEELYERMQGKQSVCLFIDNLTEFVKFVYHPSAPENNMQGFLENITEKGKHFRIYLFACFDNDSISDVAGYALFENIVRWKTGIHLGGNVAAQRLLDFDYIPFTEQSRSRKPGVGMLPAIEGEAAVKRVIIPQDRKIMKKEES